MSSLLLLLHDTAAFCSSKFEDDHMGDKNGLLFVQGLDSNVYSTILSVSFS